ncbi:hypothetical protein AB832_06780 [Flavobacteriaceae bacterium (ex Bugula neritina AB1)]|nr:hypothetical protein AB832_06780 [Flavobacteriaceae bacterium (ex Bugula neritina AB1)]
MALTLVYIAAASILLPLYFVLKRYQFLERKEKILGLYIILSTITEGLTILLAQQGQDTRGLGYMFILIEFVLLFIVLLLDLKENISNRLYYTILTLFLLFAGINFWYFEDISDSYKYLRAVECILLSVFAILYFFRVFQNPVKYDNIIIPKKSIASDPMFWISTAILVYFSLNFFLFLIIWSLSLPFMFSLWVFQHNGLLILRNVFFAIGIWKTQNH